MVLLRLGVQDGRIDTVHDEHLPEAMGRAPRVDRHGGGVYVYRRAGLPCLVCGTRSAPSCWRPQPVLVPALPAAMMGPGAEVHRADGAGADGVGTEGVDAAGVGGA